MTAYLEIKHPKECPFRKWDFDDPYDNFSMDYMCRHPKTTIMYCDKEKIPNKCPLKGEKE